MSVVTALVCPQCEKTFDRQSRLTQHVVKCSVVGALRCAAEHCDEIFHSDVVYVEHVSTIHEKTATVVNDRHANRADFITWMNDTMDQGQFKWSLPAGQHRDGVAKVRRICSRSGDDLMTGHGHRQRRARGSIKIDAECPSFLVEQEMPDGSIKTMYCLEHFGHDLCVSAVPVRETIKVCSTVYY